MSNESETIMALAAENQSLAGELLKQRSRADDAERKARNFEAQAIEYSREIAKLRRSPKKGPQPPPPRTEREVPLFGVGVALGASLAIIAVLLCS